MKRLSILALVIPFLLGGLSKHDSAYRLASDPTLNGKGKSGQCFQYALALSSRLAARGIHGRLIWFEWAMNDDSSKGQHVFVVYKSDSREWIVDNEIQNPKPVNPDSSTMQLVYLLSNHADAPVTVHLQEGLNKLSFF